MVRQLKLLSYKCVQKKGKLINDSLGQTKKNVVVWRRKDYRNAVLVLFGGKMIKNALVVVVEERKLNCRSYC